MEPRQTITIEYTAVVLNVGSNQSGTTLTNDATFVSGTGEVQTSAPALNVVAPRLKVFKSASPLVGDAGGSPITFTIVLSHDVTSTTDAFDVLLGDHVPAGLEVVPGTLLSSAGLSPTTLGVTGSLITATFDDFPLGSTSTIQFQATIDPSTKPGDVILNDAAALYTSLPGSMIVPISPYNPVSTERTGIPINPGGFVNSFSTGSIARVTELSDSLAGTVFLDHNDDGLINGADSGDPGRLRHPHRQRHPRQQCLDDDDHRRVRQLSVRRPPPRKLRHHRDAARRLRQWDQHHRVAGRHRRTTPGRRPLVDRPAGRRLHRRRRQQLRRAPPIFARGHSLRRQQRRRDPGDGRAGALGSYRHAHWSRRSGERRPCHDHRRVGVLLIPEPPPVAIPSPRRSRRASSTPSTPSARKGARSSPGDILTSIAIGQGVDGTANNFGERNASSLAGRVFLDLDNNGVFNGADSGLQGVVLTLTGADNLGNAVSMTTMTDAAGLYAFDNLRAGQYTISETQPAGYTSGINTIGSQGGLVVVPPADVLSAIMLPVGVSTDGVGNNFAERSPASLSGTVYWDANHNGRLDSPDFGIVGVKITLTGTDDLGNTIHLVTRTADDGTYRFASLQPGVYTLHETQPKRFRDYKDDVGTLGGTTTNDRFSAISAGFGARGISYNFGELKRPGCNLRNLAASVGNRVAADLRQDGKASRGLCRETPQGGVEPGPGCRPPRCFRFASRSARLRPSPAAGDERASSGVINRASHRVDLRGVPNFTTPPL